MSVNCISVGSAGHGTHLKKGVRSFIILKYLHLHDWETGIVLTSILVLLEILPFMAFIIVATSLFVRGMRQNKLHMSDAHKLINALLKDMQLTENEADIVTRA